MSGWHDRVTGLFLDREGKKWKKICWGWMSFSLNASSRHWHTRCSAGLTPDRQWADRNNVPPRDSYPGQSVSQFSYPIVPHLKDNWTKCQLIWKQWLIHRHHNKIGHERAVLISLCYAAIKSTTTSIYYPFRGNDETCHFLHTNMLNIILIVAIFVPTQHTPQVREHIKE